MSEWRNEWMNASLLPLLKTAPYEKALSWPFSVKTAISLLPSTPSSKSNFFLRHHHHLTYLFPCAPPTGGMWEFPGEGSNLRHSRNPSRCSDNVRSLTCCATRELYLLTYLGVFFFFWPFRAAGAAHGSSQAKGWSRAAAAGLHHSHGNAGSELHLQPRLQLAATLDP